MKSILLLIASLFAVSTFAADPFARYFGNYKIISCELTVDGRQMKADPECDYSHLQVGKSPKGVVMVTRLGNDGSSISEPVELFDINQPPFRSKATFIEYGDFQAWTHMLSQDEGLERRIEFKSFVFNLDRSRKPFFSIGYRIQDRLRGNGESNRVFHLERQL